MDGGWSFNLQSGDSYGQINGGIYPTMVHNGTYSAQCQLMNEGSSHSTFYQSVPTTIGVTYTFSLWTFENNQHGEIYLYYNEVGGTGTTGTSETSTDSVTTWYQISTSFVGTGNNFVVVIVFIEDGTSPGYVYLTFDEAVFTAGTIGDIAEFIIPIIIPLVAVGIIVIKTRK